MSAKNYQSLQSLKPLIGPIVTILLAGMTAWHTTQAKMAVIETRVETMNESGTVNCQKSKEKYFDQVIQIQKQLSAMDQRQIDIKEDLKEIKQQLKHR